MNVCALDVVARTPDFESLAASLELRGWEWDLLHAVDGVSSLGAVAQQLGIDNDSAIGFVHEAIHRGLLGVATMSLQAYRMRDPQAMLASPPQKSVLSSTAAATPVLPAASAPEPVEAPKPGAISFSVNSFDWNAPQESFDESEDETPAASAPATPGKTVTAHVGGVHYDERFGVEHPDGPFATARDAAATPVAEVEPVEPVAEIAHEEPVSPSVSKTGIAAVAATVAGVSAAAFGSVVEAVTHKEKPLEEPESIVEAHAPVVEPPVVEPLDVESAVVEPPAVDEPIAVEAPVAHHPVVEEPIDEAPVGMPHVIDEPHAETIAHAPVEDEPVEDPFAAAPHRDEPSVAAHEPEAVTHEPELSGTSSFAAVEDPFAVKPHAVEDPFAAKPEPVEDPFAAKPYEALEDPFAAKPHPVVEDPFAPKAHDDVVADPFAKSYAAEEPFAPVTHESNPVAEVTHHDDGPLATVTHESEPVAEIEHDDEPFAAGPIAMSIGEEDTFEPIVRHDEPLSVNGHAATTAAAHEPEEPVEDSAPGSISFSFSSDDQFDSAPAHEPAHDVYEAPAATITKPAYEAPAPAVAAAPYVAPAPAPVPETTFPEATTIEHQDVEKPKTFGETQSTYFEREAIDTDAGRELEEKAKTWKESLSWREQQQLNEAMETGKEKSGAINSLLRMLGVR